MYSRQVLQSVSLSLRSPAVRLSTRLDAEFDITPKLSINFNLYMLVLPFSSYLFIGTEEVIYFSVFSPRRSNCPSNSSANF